jgi:hypothetical protein
MARKPLLKGKSQDVINANVKTLKDAGYSHARATRCALCHANKKHDKHALDKKVTKFFSGGGTPSDPTDSGYDDV